MLVDGDNRGRSNKMGDALGGWGEAEANDATTTKAVENRIRRRQRPSLLPLLVLLLLLLRILPPSSTTIGTAIIMDPSLDTSMRNP